MPGPDPRAVRPAPWPQRGPSHPPSATPPKIEAHIKKRSPCETGLLQRRVRARPPLRGEDCRNCPEEERHKEEREEIDFLLETAAVEHDL